MYESSERSHFTVNLPRRCQPRLDRLVTTTRLTRPKLIELLLDLARPEDLVAPAIQRQSEAIPEPTHG